MRERQCMLCGRVGFLQFTRYERHYVCTKTRACGKRRKRGIPPSQRAGRVTVMAP